MGGNKIIEVEIAVSVTIQHQNIIDIKARFSKTESSRRPQGVGLRRILDGYSFILIADRVLYFIGQMTRAENNFPTTDSMKQLKDVRSNRLIVYRSKELGLISEKMLYSGAHAAPQYRNIGE